MAEKKGEGDASKSLNSVPGVRVGLGTSDDQELLDIARGSIWTADEYRRAVEAVVVGVDLGVKKKERLEEWKAELKRLLQIRYDPPLPLWWAFSDLEIASGLISANAAAEGLAGSAATLSFCRILKETLQGFCAVNSSGDTAVSAMAPVVGLLYNVACVLNRNVGDLAGNIVVEEQCAGKSFRKVCKKLKIFLGQILSYVHLCENRDNKQWENSFGLSSAPKLPIHTFPVSPLSLKFPLASKSIHKVLKRRGLDSRALADIVFIEVVLLQLAVEMIDWRSRLKKLKRQFSSRDSELLQKLKSLASHSLSGCKSLSSHELLLDVLLDKTFPSGGLLDGKEELTVKHVLCGAILVEPVCFDVLKEKKCSIPSKIDLNQASIACFKKIAVARQAITSMRLSGETRQATTLSESIMAIQVPPELMKWWSTQTKKQRPSAASLHNHQSFLNWLLIGADDISFRRIFQRCVTTWLSINVPATVSDLENQESDLHLEGDSSRGVFDERNKDCIFFVDTHGDKTSEFRSNGGAADIGFCSAAKSMRGGSETGAEKNTGGTHLFDRHKQATAAKKRSRANSGDLDAEKSGEENHEDLGDGMVKRAKSVGDVPEETSVDSKQFWDASNENKSQAEVVGQTDLNDENNGKKAQRNVTEETPENLVVVANTTLFEGSEAVGPDVVENHDNLPVDLDSTDQSLKSASEQLPWNPRSISTSMCELQDAFQVVEQDAQDNAAGEVMMDCPDLVAQKSSENQQSDVVTPDKDVRKVEGKRRKTSVAKSGKNNEVEELFKGKAGILRDILDNDVDGRVTRSCLKQLVGHVSKDEVDAPKVADSTLDQISVLETNVTQEASNDLVKSMAEEIETATPGSTNNKKRGRKNCKISAVDGTYVQSGQGLLMDFTLEIREGKGYLGSQVGACIHTPTPEVSTVNECPSAADSHAADNDYGYENGEFLHPPMPFSEGNIISQNAAARLNDTQCTKSNLDGATDPCSNKPKIGLSRAKGGLKTTGISSEGVGEQPPVPSQTLADTGLVECEVPVVNTNQSDSISKSECKSVSKSSPVRKRASEMIGVQSTDLKNGDDDVPILSILERKDSGFKGQKKDLREEGRVFSEAKDGNGDIDKDTLHKLARQGSGHADGSKLPDPECQVNQELPVTPLHTKRNTIRAQDKITIAGDMTLASPDLIDTIDLGSVPKFLSETKSADETVGAKLDIGSVDLRTPNSAAMDEPRSVSKCHTRRKTTRDLTESIGVGAMHKLVACTNTKSHVTITLSEDAGVEGKLDHCQQVSDGTELDFFVKKNIQGQTVDKEIMAQSQLEGNAVDIVVCGETPAEPAGGSRVQYQALTNDLRTPEVLAMREPTAVSEISSSWITNEGQTKDETGEEVTAERRDSPRRTRSGRRLDRLVPIPSSSRKASMRRKLALDMMAEE